MWVANSAQAVADGGLAFNSIRPVGCRSDQVRILILKPKLIGDGLMFTPLLTAMRAAYPAAEIWVVVRRTCEDILRGCPAIDHIETTAAAPIRGNRGVASWWADMRLLWRLRRQRFDYVFELGDGHRARKFMAMVGAKRAYSVKPATPFRAFWRRAFDGVSSFEWEYRHRVEKDYFSVAEFLPLLPPEPPPLVFARERTRVWPGGVDLEDFAFVHPGTRGVVKRWPREKWLDVCRFLLSRVENIVVSAGPDPIEQADALWLTAELGPRARNTGGSLSWAENADLMYRARLFVGVDTAAMHLAAACQLPAVALFGPSREVNWRPWRSPHRIVTARTPDAFETEPRWENRATADILVEDVIAGCEEMLEVGLRPSPVIGAAPSNSAAA